MVKRIHLVHSIVVGVCSIDVTEGQLSITVLYLVCALFGSSFWSYEVHSSFGFIILFKTKVMFKS